MIDYLSANCVIVCPDARYGRNCTSSCGHCSGDGTCRPLDGSCFSEDCDTGWTGTKCDLGKVIRHRKGTIILGGRGVIHNDTLCIHCNACICGLLLNLLLKWTATS
jgi:hypothetical protein